MHGGSGVTAGELAGTASGLAAGAGIELPDDLLLWRLAGGRPATEPERSDDPARALGAALERCLTPQQRRAGSHFTPRDVAEQVVGLAIERAGPRPTVVDPACGGGALLLAAADRLAAGGLQPSVVAHDLLWGADLDPLAVAVSEAAIALWSGGTPPAPGHLVAADTLACRMAAWPSPPPGFDAVVGNPPFQGQLRRGTARAATQTASLRERFGAAVAPYVDTAALFLLAATELARPGARVAMIAPQSIAATRDASAMRQAVGERADLVELWAPAGRVFDAQVHVCVPVLRVRARRPSSPDPRLAATGPRVDADWAGRLAAARGVPHVDLDGGDPDATAPIVLPATLRSRAVARPTVDDVPTPRLSGVARGTVGDRATVIAGFRDEYYGLVPHVREAGNSAVAPLLTSGAIDVGRTTWGARPVRFAKARWERPEVDLAALGPASPRLVAWLDRVRRPKAVVASQTRVVEAAPDRDGSWVPVTPVVSVVPHDPCDLARLVAALCAPPVSAWAARIAAGSALSPDAIRVGAPLVQRVPLPSDATAWAEAAEALAAGDLDAFAAAATAMYGLPADRAAEVREWWQARRPR